MKITSPKDIVYGSLKPLEIEPCFVQPVIPAYRYVERLNALRLKMKERALDAVMIYADREHFWNFKYFLGFDPRFEEALLVIREEDPSCVIMGNECFGLHKLSPIPVKPLLCQEFSLPNQPMDKYVPLPEMLRDAGIARGARVGVIGWKMFTDSEGNVRRNRFCVPHFILDAAWEVVGDWEKISNASDMLIHPDCGLRVCHDVDAIAAMEYGSALASDAVRTQQRHLRPGIRESELANDFRANGLQHTVHPFALAGKNADKGLICSSDYRISLGEGLNLCSALEGGLSCRHAYVAEKQEDLPPNRRDYVEKLVKPYYAAVVSWYENMRIGASGADIYNMIQRILPKEKYGWVLNTGHLCSSEEWQSSPFYANSDSTIRSGMILQMDIIPDVEGYHGPNAEDGVCISDSALRAEIERKYPDTYARMQARRAYMIDEIGIDLPEEVLPMSNLAAEFRPYIMNSEMGMKVRR